MVKSVLERVFGSRAKVRVLEVLVKEKEINITGLSRKSGVGFKIVKNIIEDFKEMGLVEEKAFGRIRIVKLVVDDPRVKAIINLYSRFGVRERLPR